MRAAILCRDTVYSEELCRYLTGCFPRINIRHFVDGELHEAKKFLSGLPRSILVVQANSNEYFMARELIGKFPKLTVYMIAPDSGYYLHACEFKADAYLVYPYTEQDIADELEKQKQLQK